MISFFRAPTFRLKAPTAIIALGLALAMSTGCASSTGDSATGSDDTVTEVATEVVTEVETGPVETTPGDIPERIVSLSPAATEVIEAVGAGGHLIAVDTQTPESLTDLADLPHIDMMNMDVEQIIAMQPDLLLVTEITMFGMSDEVGQIENAGTEILVLPTESSFADIEHSIAVVSDAVGKPAEGEAIVSEMQDQIAEISRIGQTVTEPKSVLFEIAPAPEIFSAGHGTFLDEMIVTVGAKNVLADQEGWVPVTEEAAIAANPDVILTNVNFVPDPVNDILTRPGFANVNAVKNHQVFAIDNQASSLPNQNIVVALKQMAQAIYPDEFADLNNVSGG